MDICWEQVIRDYDSKASTDQLIMITGQLKQDLEKIEAGRLPSRLCLHAPRWGGSLDKKTRLAHQLAENLFPDYDNSYRAIRYGQALSRMSSAVRQEDAKRARETSRWELAGTLREDIFAGLKNAPTSMGVVKPTPMPVEEAPPEELQPCFDFIARDEEVRGSQQEFKRGIVFADGRLDLCKQVVGPGSIESLMESLKTNHQIRHFLLGNNIVGPTGASAIAEAIRSHSQITTWYLAGNQIDADGIFSICESLKNNNVVKRLWLKRNPLLPAGAQHISEMLALNTTITTLDLDNCGLLDSGIKQLAKGLTANTSVQSLYISGNGITAAGAEYISQYLLKASNQGSRGLESLFMSVNRIGDDGAVSLAPAFKQNQTLVRLMLGSNQIERRGMHALCQSLQTHPKLLVLDVGVYVSTIDLGELPNRMGDEGAGAVAMLLKSNSLIQSISVVHNGLTETGAERICMAALESPSLVHLDLVEKGLSKYKISWGKVMDHLRLNIRKLYDSDESPQEFQRGLLKKLRRPPGTEYIDSEYRNRAAQSNRTAQ